ncbi:MAG: beta-lactamase family protein [Chitinophagaceae bacterium]|nr:beta-lactamase family protein [Chitinophagaceae bacterium]
MKQNKIYLLGILISLLILSCKKEVVEPPVLTGNSLISLTATKTDNPVFSEDAFVYIKNDKAYITLPQNANLSNVVLHFQISEGATLSLNGTVINNLNGSFDLTNTVKAEIKSGAGVVNTYYILAQPGIAKYDAMLYKFMEKYAIPGVSYAVMKMQNGSVVYKSGLGFADKNLRIRTKPNYLFRLGSISKQFTTICIMKLMDEGKLTLSSTVFGAGGILGNDYGTVSALAAKVTIKNLLNHTSGWTSNPDPMFTSSFRGQTLDQRISYVLSSPQTDPTTASYSYFNMGFGILGKVIEKLSGKTYEAYLTHVLSEAGITDVHVGKDLSGKRSNEVVYYSQDGTNGYLNEMDVIAAAGGLIASTEEMMKLITYIDGKSNPTDIISATARTQMLTPSSSNGRYALGWRANHPFFPGAFYHGGNLAGTGVFWVMGTEYSVAILCNSRSYIDGFDDEFYYIARDLIDDAKQRF